MLAKTPLQICAAIRLHEREPFNYRQLFLGKSICLAGWTKRAIFQSLAITNRAVPCDGIQQRF